MLREHTLRLLCVLHVFHITRIATAAAFVLVGRIGMILHRVLLLHVARVTAACAATVLVHRRIILHHVFGLHVA